MNKEKLKSFWKEFSWLIVLSILFLVIYNFLNLVIPYEFNSPDETQYFSFAKIYAETGAMEYYNPLIEFGGELIRLRGTNTVGLSVVPGAVMGFSMIAGLLAKFFGLGAIVFLTPLAAIAGVWFFYLLVKHIFVDKKIAFWASFLLLINPAWWYYATRSMFNNVFCVAVAIAGFYFLLKALEKRKKCLYILSGIAFGLALITRLSEIVWLGMAVILILFLNQRKIDWAGLGLGLLASILVFLPLLNLNQQTFGTWMAFGYNPLGVKSGANLNQATSMFSRFFVMLKTVIIPFGISLRYIVINVWDFIIKFFWPINILLLLTLGLLIKKRDKVNKKMRGLIFVSIVISALLVIIYGSWYFSDSIGSDRVNIGASYLRYFLPIYILTLPWLAWFLVELKKTSKLNRWLMAILIVFLSIFGLKAVYLDMDSGVIKIWEALAQNKQIYELVDQNTPENSVYITFALDKTFWPDKSVIYKLETDEDFEVVKNLIKQDQHVYWFIFTKDYEAWSKEGIAKLEQFDLNIHSAEKIYDLFWLVEVK